MALLWLGVLAGCTEYDVIVHDGADIFYQDPASAVDILLIVDDSCSMQPYQNELSKNFSQFISFFVDANVDYQIGVVTTDVTAASAGRLIDSQIITNDTPDGNAVFEDIVRVGIDGSGNEMGLEAAYLALTEPRLSTSNAGFLRDEAMLSIIFVSDEEDSSPLPTYEYVRTFNDIKGARERDVFNASALVVTDVSSCGMNSGSSEGDRYMDVAERTVGITGNICDDSFADVVTELSLNASRLKDTFFLSSEPDATSLEVSVDGVLMLCDDGSHTFERVTDEFGEDRPAIVFSREWIPEPSSQIAIRYYYGNGAVDGYCADGEEDAGTTDTGA
ncbi:MAG: hypothetical protein GY913_19820 [Proteobacteria bacterium]|nr:hypothetical protein [Pseudomonadota bacterium]MCP4919157.1 hypothetical protein [Pseudomonadota bacterium]